MTKRKNVQSLDTIAEKIHGLERANIIDIGDLLLEAKAQIDHGDWLDWLRSEFEWSVNTAERYMKAAELRSKFSNLGNLRLAKGTLYRLADHDNDEELPTIIAELAKHATKTRLRPHDAERVINIGIGRHCFGDYPDATLAHLMSLNSQLHYGLGWTEKAIAALKEQKPKTNKAALSIIDEIRLDSWLKLQEADETARAEQEAEHILDGPPPELPPSTSLSEPQKLGANTEWPEAKSFVGAIEELQRLHAKPVARFVGTFMPAELREVADFLMAIAAADETASVSPPPAMQSRDDGNALRQ
jgi:hypothetical protein